MGVNTMASVSDTIQAINDACRARGGAYSQYSCKTVSWDDVQRGTVGGSLSCWGSNITDTRLYEKNGRQLFTVRPDNWNEKLGKVSTGEVALLVGNEERSGAELQPVTLRQYLKNIGQYGSYAGLKPSQKLDDDALDREVSIRFQTTFLPVEEGDGAGRETLEFAPEAYSYSTTHDSDPRNLVLLCTTQGTAVQQDGRGAKKLFHHAVDESGSVHRYWLEAEASDHKVGGAQKETAEEKADALARGKATSSVIGVRAMGTRFNVLMTIQVPLKQKPRAHRRGSNQYLACSAELDDSGSWFGGGGSWFGGGMSLGMGMTCSAMQAPCVEYDDEESHNECACAPPAAPPPHHTKMDLMDICDAVEPVYRSRRRSRSHSIPRKVGRATAARVSRGTEHDTWRGLSVKEPQRN